MADPHDWQQSDSAAGTDPFMASVVVWLAALTCAYVVSAVMLPPNCLCIDTCALAYEQAQPLI